MRKTLLLCVVLMASAMGWATSYSCNGTGTKNWHTSSDWSPSGTPTAGDTVTIGNACTMQCEAGQSCAAGTSTAGAGSTDFTVSSGGMFKALAGSTVTVTGNVSMAGELDVFGAQFIQKPPSGGTYLIDFNVTGTKTLKVCAESTCSTTGTLAVLKCDTSNGGGARCQIRHTSGTGTNVDLEGYYGQVTGFGDASNYALYMDDGTVPSNGIRLRKFSFHDNGFVRFGYVGATKYETLDGVSFSAGRDVSGSPNGYEMAAIVESAAATSGDRTTRLTCAQPSGTHPMTVYINRPSDGGIGDASSSGWVGFNCGLARSSNGGTAQGLLSIYDDAVGGLGHALEPGKNCGQTYNDVAIMNHAFNQHSIVGVDTACGGTANSYNRAVFDGDGYVASDAGDDYQDLGTYTGAYSYHINNSGTIFTANSNTGEVITLDHLTAYSTFSGSLCETANCYTGIFAALKNSCIVKPSAEYGNNYLGGIHAGGGFDRTLRQVATSSNTDYNAFWQMPGSGDAGSPTGSNTPNVKLGSTPSWLQLPLGTANIASGAYTITGGTSLSCSSCLTNAQAKDYVVDTTRTPNTYAVIQTRTDASNAVLYAAIPSYQAGDTLEIRPAYFASNGYYGVDFGTHDQHLNPFFQDPTRTICSWWKKQTGSANQCNFTGTGVTAGDFTATSGTTTTQLNDSSVNFSTLGVVDNVDIVAVSNGAFGGFRGYATVTGHTATSLTVSPAITGAASGDHFTIVTAARNLGLAAVQLYGFDASGNAVTPPAWVTPTIAKDIVAYIKDGFTPTNQAMLRAAGDGQTMCAAEVIPPNGGVVLSQ